MENLNDHNHRQLLETPDNKDKENDFVENNVLVPPDINKDKSSAQKASSDQQSAQMVRQAIKDDQALSAVAGDIQVTVKDGAITLDGQVSTEQQMNLVTNTATAIGMVDEINNRMVITEETSVKDSFKEYQNAKKASSEKGAMQESAKAQARADDDGFAISEESR